MPFVDHTGQTSGAGQHGQQRNLRQRHGRSAIVDEQDLVTGQGQLIATTGRCAVDRRDPDLPRVCRGILDRVASLVRELAEVDLVLVGGAGQHLDVGAGTKDLVETTSDNDDTHLGVLESQSLDNVVQLDVDPEVVRVHLQLVARPETPRRIDRKGQRRHRRFDRQRPMPVRLGIDGKVDGCVRHAVLDPARHDPSPCRPTST